MNASKIRAATQRQHLHTAYHGEHASQYTYAQAGEKCSYGRNCQRGKTASKGRLATMIRTKPKKGTTKRKEENATSGTGFIQVRHRHRKKRNNGSPSAHVERNTSSPSVRHCHRNNEILVRHQVSRSSTRQTRRHERTEPRLLCILSIMPYAHEDR
eukprot:5199646-Pleurochrysis_carterae.AAC.3